MIDNTMIFKIEDYEGPLDLLLDMFKTNKLEIIKVNLDIILDQYLEYIDLLKQSNYDLAVEYLDVASEIILYKSKKILHEEVEEEVEEEIFDQDELINKILEYKKYKEVSKEIHVLKEQRNQYLTKESGDLSFYKSKDIQPISIEEFYSIIQETFLKIDHLKKREKKRVIQKKDFNIEEYIQKLKEYKEIKFKQYLETIEEDEIIIFFLSVLELLKGSNYDLLRTDKDLIIIKKENL